MVIRSYDAECDTIKQFFENAKEKLIQGDKEGAADLFGKVVISYLVSDEDRQYCFTQLLQLADQNCVNALKICSFVYQYGKYGWIEKEFVNEDGSLTRIYLSGFTITDPDGKKAMAYMEKAAELGDLDAMENCGYLYEAGKIVPKDLQKAFVYFLACAEKGYKDTQSVVAGMYLKGEGVKKNRRKAKYWYRKAAEGGDTFAQSMLEQLKGFSLFR